MQIYLEMRCDRVGRRIISALKTDFSVRRYTYGQIVKSYDFEPLMDSYMIDVPENLPYYRKFENPKGRKFNVNKRK